MILRQFSFFLKPIYKVERPKSNYLFKFLLASKLLLPFNYTALQHLFIIQFFQYFHFHQIHQKHKLGNPQKSYYGFTKLVHPCLIRVFAESFCCLILFTFLFSQKISMYYFVLQQSSMNIHALR